VLVDVTLNIGRGESNRPRAKFEARKFATPIQQQDGLWVPPERLADLPRGLERRDLLGDFLGDFEVGTCQGMLPPDAEASIRGSSRRLYVFFASPGFLLPREQP
jgi:hypothetical protein